MYQQLQALSQRTCWLTVQALVFLAPLHALGCTLDPLDALDLVRISTDGSSMVGSLAGQKVECAEVGPLRVIRVPARGAVFVLDTERAFHRWWRGPVFAGEDYRTPLRVFLESANLYSQSELWLRFGRRQPVDAKAVLEQAETANWNTIDLPTSDKEARIAVAARTLEQGWTKSVIPALVEDQVRLALVRNGFTTTTPQLNYLPPKGLERELAVEARFEWRGKPFVVQLLVPVNFAAAPYVGKPRILTRDPPK